MAWDIQSDDLIPIPILLPVNVDPLTRRSNLQTRQEEGIVTTIVSPYTKGWYDEGETKKSARSENINPIVEPSPKPGDTEVVLRCFWLSGGTIFSDPSQVPLPSVPFLFLNWIWSWRNWIGMIQSWLSYQMFPWLETTFPIWGQPRQGGQPMSWTCQVETSPCLTGYRDTLNMATGFGVVFPSKIFGQTSSRPCSVKISEKQASKQTSKLWDFNLWYLKNIWYIKTHGILELQTPWPPGQGSLEAVASVVSSWTRSAQPTPRWSGDGPAQLANLGLVLTVGDYLSE